MYSIFYYIKIDPQYYFFSKCVKLLFFARLLEVKKILRE